MSEIDEVDGANRAETIRFFAVACLVVAALGLARTTAGLVSWNAWRGSEARHLNNIASLMSSWCLVGVLLAAGLGLLWMRPWGRWLALGYAVVNVIWSIISAGYIMVSYLRVVDRVSVCIGVREGVSTILALSLSIPLLAFMLLLWTRTTLRSAPPTPDAISPGIPGGLVVREVRTMGWLVLLFATSLLTGPVFGIVLSFCINSMPAVEPRDALGFAAYTRLSHAAKTEEIVLAPFFLATYVVNITAGFGMIKGRPWARRTAVLSASVWLAVITAQILVSWFVMLRYPIPDIPALSPVAEIAGTAALVLASLGYLIFPALFLAFVCLPHIRKHGIVKPLKECLTGDDLVASPSA